MGYKLKDETKAIIEKHVGLTIEEITKMDLNEEIKFVEQKTGKKLTWPKDAKVDGLPIRTMEDVDRKIEEMIREDEKKEKQNIINKFKHWREK